MKKIGVIFGGRSGEHDISRLSAASVLRAINRDKYDAVPIGVKRDGIWHIFTGSVENIESGSWEKTAEEISPYRLRDYVDFVFPVIHGTFGEDGSLQGLLELLDIPYAGSGVLSSAVCMDKGMTKDICIKEKIPTCKYKLVRTDDLNRNIVNIVKEISEDLRGPLFVKPANAGSSLGVSKVEDMMDMGKALALAGSFDRRIIVEEAVDGRELEIGVIGNDVPIVAKVGEITRDERFEYYDYEAKYSDSSGTKLEIPADIPDKTAAKIRDYAIKIYQACDCAGYARVDFFLDKATGKVMFNEINTIPGLTKYSLFPLMWQEAGVEFGELIDKIVEFGYERYNDKNSRQTLRTR